MGRKAKTPAEKLQAQQARQNRYQLRSLNQSYSSTSLSVLPESTSSSIPAVLAPSISSPVLHAASEQNEPFDGLVNLFADAQLDVKSNPETDHPLLPAEAHEESDINLNILLDYHSTTLDGLNSESNELLNLSFASNQEPSTVQGQLDVADEAGLELDAFRQSLELLDSSNISSSVATDVLERDDDIADTQSLTLSETNSDDALGLDHEIDE
ncbi:MAG: hypothetical protein M1824_002471 [Vezdaea acicularis]|nr:MAG: hypothetical protein M1824_002471 [Vezdaea acicularis]